MKKFNEWAEKRLQENLPGGPMHDRSLEGFDYLLNQLKTHIKGITDSNAQAEMWPIVNEFESKLQSVLQKYTAQKKPTFQQVGPPPPPPLGPPPPPPPGGKPQGNDQSWGQAGAWAG